ncbi:MAG TPA: exodeoxyribonuclease VII small subunit [Streptosporangiaceae bacterium]
MTAEHGAAPRPNGARNTSGPDRPGSDQADRLPYEKARDELTDVVKRLEAGGLTLEQSLDLWERGERLAAICEEWLEGARARLAAAVADRKADQGDPPAPF